MGFLSIKKILIAPVLVVSALSILNASERTTVRIGDSLRITDAKEMGLTAISENSEIGSGWVNEGAGDFNGDGYADILWKQADGNHLIWRMAPWGKRGSIWVGKASSIAQP